MHRDMALCLQVYTHATYKYGMQMQRYPADTQTHTHTHTHTHSTTQQRRITVRRREQDTRLRLLVGRSPLETRSTTCSVVYVVLIGGGDGMRFVVRAVV